LAVATLARDAAAEEPVAAEGSVRIERAEVRYVTPETGGVGRPRFLTSRVVSFMATFEALSETSGPPLERHRKVATDRLIAEDMLASLFLRRRPDPPQMAALTRDLVHDLSVRAGGDAALDKLLEENLLTRSDLGRLLSTKARALYYVDQAVASILREREDELRDGFRTLPHPFRNATYEEKRDDFARWFLVEKLRRVELEYLEGARARVRVVAL
jgi:hypothetical protein